jgi:hypothetical protein
LAACVICCILYVKRGYPHTVTCGLAVAFFILINNYALHTMKSITIAVTPLVRSILKNRYGTPVQVYRSDALYTYLQGNPIRVNQKKFRKLKKELTEKVSLMVSPTLYRRLIAKQRYLTIGFLLHKIFQEEMLTYMRAQNNAGIPAQQALKEFLSLNGVSEDDYALDSAYTAWKRKKEFFAKKTVVSWLQTDPPETEENDSFLPDDPREILSAVNQYYSCGIVNIVCKNIRIEALGKTFTYIYDPELAKYYRHCRKVAAYLLYKDAHLNCVAISKIIKLSPRTIQRYVKSTRFYMDYYTDMQRDTVQIRQIYRR